MARKPPADTGTSDSLLPDDRAGTASTIGAAAASSPARAQPSPVADFEHSLDALEQLVETMEHGELSLEQSLAAYERGVGLYRRCQQALEQAELRVRLLSDPTQPGDGQPFAAMPSPDA